MSGEYISRETLRDLMYTEAFERDTGLQRWDSGLWIRYKLFENCIDAIPAADVVEQPRWIPVTERCPEKSGDYLVFDDCRNLYVNEWHCLLKKWQYDDSRITHWMPLPEPPKEET